KKRFYLLWTQPNLPLSILRSPKGLSLTPTQSAGRRNTSSSSARYLLVQELLRRAARAYDKSTGLILKTDAPVPVPSTRPRRNGCTSFPRPCPTSFAATDLRPPG